MATRALTVRAALIAVIALASALLALAPPPACAQLPSEAVLKARLTLGLTRFVQWPVAAGGEWLRVCLAQREAAILQAFAEFDGQLINGRRIQLVKAPPLAGCHVLYVHASAERPADLVRSVAGAPVLVLGDAEGLLAMGGMVEFVPVNDAIRFDVHTGAMRHAQLSVSSQVLKLARQVRE